jgi:hypothetical protein
MADDGHFAQAARAWCEEALARLLPDLDRGARCPAFKRTPSVKQLKKFAGSGDGLGCRGSMGHETNCLPLQRPRAA